MIIYTNLDENYQTDKVIDPFLELQSIAGRYGILLKNGIVEIPLPENKPDKIIFWFAKSNASKLHYYRAVEALENIYNGLKVLENHTELF